MTRLAIIGTAGRKDDGPKMSKDLYHKMYSFAQDWIHMYCGTTPHLVSGGAAWADHLAVSLYLSGGFEHLTLYLPAYFDVASAHYREEGKCARTARTANYYHRLFSTKMRGNTLRGISKAIHKGARVVVNPNGFQARNLQVGDVDSILAFTWGKGPQPKAGGTLHTFQNSQAGLKFHVSLDDLQTINQARWYWLLRGKDDIH